MGLIAVDRSTLSFSCNWDFPPKCGHILIGNVNSPCCLAFFYERFGGGLTGHLTFMQPLLDSEWISIPWNHKEFWFWLVAVACSPVDCDTWAHQQWLKWHYHTWTKLASKSNWWVARLARLRFALHGISVWSCHWRKDRDKFWSFPVCLRRSAAEGLSL